MTNKTALQELIEWIEDWLDRKRAEKIVKRLHTISKDYWMGISNTFNRWNFPEQFYDLIPNWWLKGGKRNMERAMNVIRPVMREVDKCFSEKEQLRFHNVSKGRMTDGEFEYWFEKCSSRSTNEKSDENLSKFYDRRRYIETIEWWEDDVFEAIKTANEKFNQTFIQ